MKDSMNSLFSDRFHGHEMPVDPGVWQSIQQQMAHVATVSGADGVSQLFKDRFQAHETAVDPSVWQGVASHLGHATTVGSISGLGSLTWAAAGIAAVAIGTAAYFMGPSFAPTPNVPIAQVAAPPSIVLENVPTRNDKAQVADAVIAGAVVAEVPTTTPSNARVPERTWSTPVVPARTMAPITERAVTPAPVKVVEEPGHALVEQIITEITEQAKQAANQEVRTTTDPIQQIVVGGAPEPVYEELPTMEQAALPDLFMPNTFTPNGDGVNDDYEIGTDGFEKLLFRVYSMKTNQLVFSTNTGEKWTGSQCEDGYYLVAIEAITNDARLVTEAKVVWLNRNRLN